MSWSLLVTENIVLDSDLSTTTLANRTVKRENVERNVELPATYLIIF